MKSIIFPFIAVLLFFFAIAPLRAEEVIGFTGQEYSEITELSFLRARFYDPEAGAFVSRDPIGIADGLNTYQYAKLNPINRIDRTGNVVETVWDVANLGIGLGSLGYNLWNKNWGYAALDAGGLVIDGLATAVPFIPGGAAAAIKAGRGIDTAVTVATTLKKTEVAVKEVAEAAAKKGIQLTPQRFGSLVHDQVDVAHLKNWDINVRPGSKGVDFHSPDKAWMMDITTFKKWPTHNKYPEVADTIVGILYDTSGTIGVGKGLFEASNTGGRLWAGAGALNGTKSLFDYFYSTGNESGVLIDKAATLIESNLADIKGATYDPVSKQIIFLGSNTTPGVEGIDMDYFYTAVNSVYGSAAPPSVSLDAPASASSLWQDFGDGDGVYEAGEWGGCSLRYNPLWSEQDTNIKVRIKCTVSGTNYDFAANFAPQTVDWLQFPNGEYPMHLVFIGTSGTAPPGTCVSGNTRVWFLAEEMALKRHSDTASDRATMVFDRSIVGVKTESALNFQAQSPGVAAFASHLQTNFAALNNHTI